MRPFLLLPMLFVSGCASLQVPVQKDYPVKPFSGFYADSVSIPSSLSKIGTTSGRLAGQGWKLNDGWLFPLTRGRLVWFDGTFSGETKLPGKISDSGILVGGDWYGTPIQAGQSVLVKVNLQTGKTTELQTIMGSVTLVSGDTTSLVAITTGNTIVRINLHTGNFQWKMQLPATDYCLDVKNSGDTLLVLSSGGARYHLEKATGRILHREVLPHRIGRVFFTNGRVVVFKSEETEDTFILDAAGSLNTIPGFPSADLAENSLTVVDDSIYGITHKGLVFSVNLQTRILSEITTLEKGSGLPVTIAGNHLIVAGYDSMVTFIPLGSISAAHRISLGGPPATSPLIFNGNILIQRKDHEWYISK